MGIYRSHFLPEDSIAFIPSNGYTRGRDNFSNTSIEWLEYEASKRGTYIRHALNHNSGEYKIPGTRWRVDGFIEPQNPEEGMGTVLEFYG